MLRITTPLVARRVQLSNHVIRLERKLEKLRAKLVKLNTKSALVATDIEALEEQIADNKILVGKMVELENDLSASIEKATKTTTKQNS